MVLADYLWFLAVAIGPIVLGAAALIVLMRRRRLRPGEQAARDAATEKLYRRGP